MNAYTSRLPDVMSPAHQEGKMIGKGLSLSAVSTNGTDLRL